MASADNVDQQTASEPVSSLPITTFARPIWLCVVLVLITVALYYPVHQHPFINYDDNDYVYENQQVRSGLSWTTLKWAFTTSTASNWHPLTWLSHATDYQLFGANPAGHHDVNLLFHAIDVVLLFWVLLRATGLPGRSFMVAALFAVHPINVESVAWVAERKTILSMAFFLLALGAYGWYAERRTWSRYATVALLFVLGLMAKPQIITFPFVLLPMGLLAAPTHVSSESIPAMEASDGTSNKQREPAKPDRREDAVVRFGRRRARLSPCTPRQTARGWFTHSSRAGNAVLSYGLYIKKALWPTDLALLYPHPGPSLNWWKVVTICGHSRPAITIFVLIGRRHRYLPVGWFWFLGTLVPMMGIVQVGVQSMADRYAYVSFLGLFIMICWGITEFFEWRRLPPALLGSLSAVVLLSLGLAARQQLNLWQQEELLWEHALKVTDRNWVAESQLGAALAMHGSVPEAAVHFDNALAINPDDANSNLGIAIYDLQQGNFSDAIVHYQIVIRQPNDSPLLFATVVLRTGPIVSSSRRAAEVAGLPAKTEEPEVHERDSRNLG